MAKRFLCLVVLAAFCFAGATELLAQTSSVGQLVGTVSDQTGAVIAGATVKIKDDATGALFETKSSADGHFAAANLRPGNYTVTVSMTGFKTAEFRAVKITIGQVYDLGAKLEVGALESTVVVEAGAEVLETASTTVGTSITGKSITQLPLTSRDALDLAILMPGAATTGRARQTSFMGLPKGAINITMDGINAQDNLLKSNDGFFTLIRPRVDSMEEFSIATAGQGAEQSAEGAVQIRFETKRGGNVFHGGGWWYHRNDFFNSNYWFSNLTGTPRQRQRLNQFGGNVGGPAWKDKLFFFVSMDNYRNPGSQARTRTILTPDSLAGNFDYVPCTPPGTTANPCSFVFSAAPNAWTTCVSASTRNPNGGQLCTVNLLTLRNSVGTNPGPDPRTGYPTAIDPFAMGILNAVDSSRTVPGVSVGKITSPWLDTISFNNPGDATRRFPDIRLDYNITKNIQWTGIYHYQYFAATPDFLNGLDQTFPVAPFNKNQGSQISNRNEWVTAVRWNIGANKSNEVRAGLVTSPVSFFPDMNLATYAPGTTNVSTINMRTTFPSITNPLPAFNVQGRNGGIFQLIETFSWSKGKHNLNFGGNWSRVRLVGYFADAAVNTIALGMPGSDPNTGLMFTGTNFPGASTTDFGTNAPNLYGMLTGRVTSYTGSIYVNENSRQFVPARPLMQRTNQNEFGIYGADSWRIHPQLTINFGVRWELQLAGVDPKNLAYRPVGGEAGAFGQSGLNNLFKPGTLPGNPTFFELNGNREWYAKDLHNFAPNVGLAWTPNIENKMWKTIFGESGKTVLRATYSIVYTREGINAWQSTAFTNPGATGSIFDNAVSLGTGVSCPAAPYTTTTFTAGTYPGGCLTASSFFGGALQTVTTNPAAFPGSTPFQLLAFSGQQAAMFDPNLRIPIVHNWSGGIQREVTPSLVVEVRYVGNHGNGLWRLDNLNEINIFENGFLTEFGNAKANLAAFRAANPLCGRTGQPACSFAPGPNPLPIMTQMFTGLSGSSGFSSGTFVSALDQNAPGTFAANVANSSTYLCRLVGSTAIAAGGANPCPASAPAGPTAYPVNFWTANPQATSGSFRLRNQANSTYNGLTVEVRKRYSKGLQFSGNYTFAKALTDYFGDSSSTNVNLTTLRNPSFDKGPSPWDLRHTFKFNSIYSFPFGPGRKWTSSHAFVNRIIEGWELSGIWRWQSGRVFLLQSGTSNRTFNGQDSGVTLIGITPKQIQKSLGIRKLPTGQVYYFPATLIGANGASNTSFIAPCTTAGQLCQKVFLYGPNFFRVDVNIVKKFKIYERYELEYRAEFLNAFNNINFFFPGSETTSVPTSSITGTSFGQVTNAFRDVSTTDDNGGRIIQMVLRIRF